MASKEARQRKLKEIQEVAEGWGKMIAREAFPDGPGLNVTLADMEECAVAASRALVKGAVESMTATQGGQLGEEAPCPTCGRMCPLKRKSRPVAVRGGEAIWMNRWATARRVAGIFFPQRPVLKLDGHGYSPTILHRILHIASVTSAFDVSATALKVVGEISISARQINNLVNEVGQELAADRDATTEQYVNAPLP